jgi:hypothetical protein
VQETREIKRAVQIFLVIILSVHTVVRTSRAKSYGLRNALYHTVLYRTALNGIYKKYTDSTIRCAHGWQPYVSLVPTIDLTRFGRYSATIDRLRSSI